METEGIIERIRKLLRLAQSDNEHEAALAASRAAEMLERHNLDLAIVEAAGKAPETTVDVETLVLNPNGTSSRWQGVIASGLAKTAYCRVWYAGGMRTGKLSVLGTRENRAAVVEMHAWLCSQVEKIARQAFGRRGRQQERKAYMLGAAETIRLRLMQEHQARTATSEASTALVVAHQARNQTWLADNGVKLNSARRTRLAGASWNSYQDGRAAGQSISLRPQRAVQGGRRQIA
jgi:hypothetical protein